MSFRVDPPAVRNYGAQFPGHAEDAHAMHAYIAGHSSLGWHEQGLINKFLPAHERFVGEVTTALAHLRDLLDRSGTELMDLAAFYERTDQATAGRLDGSYPPVARPSARDAKEG